MLKNYKFRLCVDCSHLYFDLLLQRFWFSLLTFIKFSVYSRLLYFHPGWNFWDNCNFFNLVYRVEISTRDKNLNGISSLEAKILNLRLFYDFVLFYSSICFSVLFTVYFESVKMSEFVSLKKCLVITWDLQSFISHTWKTIKIEKNINFLLKMFLKISSYRLCCLLFAKYSLL